MSDTLGKRIAENRKRIKLTQDQLAEKLGVTAQAVSKWENDLSCPDIGTVPLLADIFGISIDSLLGHKEQAPVHEAQVIDPETQDDAHTNSHRMKMDLQLDGGKTGMLSLAVLVLFVGTLYLLSALFTWNLSLWELLWPSALLVFGLFGLFSKFSFFSIGCVTLGSFFLANKLFTHTITSNKLLWAIVIILFGLSMLIDTFRRSKKRVTCHTGDSSMEQSKRTSNYSISENSFSYCASFNEEYKKICMSDLEHGDVSVCFGEYTVDLSGITNTISGCTLDANCCFGDLTLLIPSNFALKPDSSSVFASIVTEGQPADTANQEILLDASVTFGQITIRYV